MLKALIKKELSQLGSFYFFNSRKGKKRTPASTAGFILLFVFLFLSLAMMFFGLAYALSEQLIPAGLGWLYFAMMGLTAVMIGVIGSVFTTHTILYKAGDNESLLAMPIPPSKILLSRMLIVYGFSLVLVLLVWVPAIIRYAAMGASGAVPVLLQILLAFMLAAVVTVLNCILGWLVALISVRIRNKSAATVLLSLLFLGAYYYLYFKIRDVLELVLTNLDKFEAAFRGWGWPMYQLGLGAAGKVPSALIFSLIAVGLLAVSCAVLSATFIRILTTTHTGKKAVYREKRSERSSESSALLYKEAKRFTGSATYMLNSGLNSLLMLALAVLAAVKANELRMIAGQYLPTIGLGNALPLLCVCAVCLICSMGSFTAPSVSLEGKHIWVLQTMPVSEKKVLRAKENMQMLLYCIPAAVLLAAVIIVLRLSVWEGLVMMFFMLAFNRLMAAFGLMMNLLKPNLSWSNEAVPIKQGLPVLFSMLLGLFAAAASFALGLLLSGVIGAAAAVAVIGAVLLVGALLIDRRIGREGAEIFAHLN